MKHWHQQDKDERAATIDDLKAQKLTFPEMAEHLGCTTDTLRGALGRAGIPHPYVEQSEWSMLGTGEARMKRIKELDASGELSPAGIAKALGTTRGAVVTLAYHMGVPLIASGKRVRIMPKFQEMPELPPETWRHVHWEPPVVSGENGCQWPVGEATGSQMKVCGAKRHKRRYCEHHHAIAYLPAAPAPGGVSEKHRKPKTMTSKTAMRLTGVSARRIEHAE